MVFIYYSKIDAPLAEEKWHTLCAKLPAQEQEYVERFYHWRDRHTRLIARLLLQKGLIGMGAASECLQFVQKTKYERPFLEGNIDFNISHSGNYVVCALAYNTRVGIDIEHIHQITFDDFQSFMSADEWVRIHQSVSPQEEFFRWWTLKESVLKADGRGLSALANQMTIQGNRAHIGEQTWYFHEIMIENGYLCHLACNDEFQEIHPRRIRF